MMLGRIEDVQTHEVRKGRMHLGNVEWLEQRKPVGVEQNVNQESKLGSAHSREAESLEA